MFNRQINFQWAIFNSELFVCQRVAQPGPVWLESMDDNRHGKDYSMMWDWNQRLYGDLMVGIWGFIFLRTPPAQKKRNNKTIRIQKKVKALGSM
jgi:hypothetical protein